MGVFVGALRGTAPTLAEEALGKISFRAVREGMVLFASKARSGPIPLPLGFPPKKIPCRPGLLTRRAASVHERMGMNGRVRGGAPRDRAYAR